MSFFSHVGGGEVERICDLCGIRRAMRRLRNVGKYYVCEKHPGYVTREALDRTPYITVGAPELVRDAKGFEPRDTFEAAESEIFKFITTSTLGTDSHTITTGALLPNAVVANTVSYTNVALQAFYLYELITEAQRPIAWIEVATARLKDVAEYLLAHQVAGPEVGTAANSAMEWGAYLRSSFYNAIDSADAGIALLRAYQILGDSRYLAGARACAWFLRSAQCGDMLVTKPSSTDSAGASPKHWGMWSNLVQPTTNLFTHRYTGGDLAGLEFLNLFLSVAGDEVIGSSATTATFNASRAALVSTCIAEAKAFWTSPIWSVDDGAMVQGLSTTTPYNDFDSYPAAKTVVSGRGSWRFLEGNTSPTTGETVSASNFVRAIRAFRAVDGDSAFVTGLFSWLSTLAGNSTLELPATTSGRLVSGYDDRYVTSRQLGTFDPETACPSTITCRAGSPLVRIAPKITSAFYNLSNTGLLADLYAASFPAKFKALKQALSIPRARSVDGAGNISLGLLGTCGLSFQPFNASTTRVASVAAAARTGLIYRREPKAAMGRGI